MPTQKINLSSTEPVFIMSRYLPDNVDVISMCRAAEAVSGAGSVKGAFGDGGLWRIYPKTAVARALLLSKGISVNKQRIQPESINPFILQGTDSEIPATRLSVGPLAFSYSDEFIIRHLESLGLRLRSKLVWENERFKDRSMSDWNNGKRFVWIDLPENPPDEFVRFGSAKVKLFYREMKQQRMKCRSCLQFGHRAADCTNDPVCYACGEVGHKSNDPICSHFTPRHPPGDERDHGWDLDRDWGFQCSRCLEYGHGRAECTHKGGCWDCKCTGHKSGDPVCDVVKGKSRDDREGDASFLPPGGADVVGADSDVDNDDVVNDIEENDGDDEDDQVVESEGKHLSEDIGSDDSSYEDAKDEDNPDKTKSISADINGSHVDKVLVQDDVNDVEKVDNVDGDNVMNVSQVLNCSQGTASESERYVILDGEVTNESDLRHSETGKAANTTFTCSPSLNTEPKDSANDHNSFSPSVDSVLKSSFPEYASSEDEGTVAGVSQDPLPQRKVRKQKKSYAEAVSGGEDLSDEEEPKSKSDKKVPKKGKKSLKGSRSDKKTLSQVPITQFTEGAGELRVSKRTELASSPDGLSKGIQEKFQKL